MADRWRGLAIIGAASATIACAHVVPAPSALPLSTADPAALPELGEDLPAALAPPPTPVRRHVRLFSIDTPVSELCRHPDAKAVVDRDLPGLTARPEYAFFKHMSLRQLQAASRGRMTRADLARVSADLKAMPPGHAAEPAVARVALAPRVSPKS